MPNAQLSLPDNCPPLEKNSYVNIRQCYSVQLEALRPYRRDGRDPTLGKASLKALKEASAFIDLYDPNTPKKLRDAKAWEMIGKSPKKVSSRGEDIPSPQEEAFHAPRCSGFVVVLGLAGSFRAILVAMSLFDMPLILKPRY
ncbi:uncharacterized protein ColSpa_09684 [Colletotrichum spaethianum]|uniref:Uncharacterized protein n=1 Tax=Colletotrichum spaethianum TaxID=700344 RepID=A0AA37US84_9PEZI|nr:uncharacterized protein ColSpa_09684 [Colletotrichum spaethianum]GKT49503.1 hypothetical protein ColSpa_09684 [Colletotrichum spaethianum]